MYYELWKPSKEFNLSLIWIALSVSFAMKNMFNIIKLYIKSGLLLLLFMYPNMYSIYQNSFRVATWPGKTEKNDKSQVKMGVFEKGQEKIFKKHQILSVQFFQFPYI